jgi:hypothetical protein
MTGKLAENYVPAKRKENVVKDRPLDVLAGAFSLSNIIIHHSRCPVEIPFPPPLPLYF